jgi:hypothetical protein
MSSLWLVTLCVAEDADNKIARLGFTFDPKAHEQAGAKENSDSEIQTDNNVLRLPKYQVTGKRLPFNEREILTPKGRLVLAKKTYLTPAYQKTLGPLSALAGFLANPLGGWQPNDPEAMALYEDVQQKRRNTEMKYLAGMARTADQSAAKPTAEETPAK